MPDTIKSVCFICDHNAIRSPMAAALLKRHRQEPGFLSSSAGCEPRPINPFAAAVMKEMGFDLLHHEPLRWDEKDVARFDTLIFLGDRVPPSLAFAHHWQVGLPATDGNRDQILQAFRDLRDDLDARIKARF